ncbi:MAG: hypothetical protein ABJN43_18530 [Sneathiella sp.]
MIDQIILTLHRNKNFWLARSKALKLLFELKAQKYLISAKIQNASSALSSAKSITQITFMPILSAVTLAGLMQLGNSHLKLNLQEILSIQQSINDEFYITLLATISGIGGIFIGLYYAGISAVSSTIYARVPNNVRNLLSQEKFGNFYLSFLAFTTFFCIVLITLKTIGLPVIQLAIPLVIFFSGIGIFAFVKLGQRAFNFFNPTALSSHIFHDLCKSLQSVVAGGYQWNDASFQNHAHKQATISFETLKTLADITEQEDHLRGRPFIELANKCLMFLISYEKARHKIPTNSKWYKSVYLQQEWYKARDSETSIAHQTSTRLIPKDGADYDWVENNCMAIIKQCIKANILDNQYAQLSEIFPYFQAYISKIVLLGNIEKSQKTVKEFSGIFFENLNHSAEDQDVILEQLAIVDQLGKMMIDTLLEYRKTLPSLSYEYTKAKISSVNWNSKTEIYDKELPSYWISQLEWLQPRLNYERRVRGEYVTPLWYQLEIITLNEVQQFSLNIDSIVDGGLSFFKELIEDSISKKQPWIAAILVSQEWEYWNKVNYQKNDWLSIIHDFELNRKLDDLPWRSIEISELSNKIDHRKKALLKNMATLEPVLSLGNRPADFPDFSGQFLHTTGEAVFEALLENDLEYFTVGFQQYFFSSLLKYDNLKPKVTSENMTLSHDVLISLSPIIDLITISGYAKLLSEYYKNPDLWEITAQIWDQYLEKDQGGERLKFISLTLNVNETNFYVVPRGEMRFQWQRAIRGKLSEVPRREVYSKGMYFPQEIADHESSLVRILAIRDSYNFYKPTDIFCHFYLSSRKETGDLSFTKHSKDLNRALGQEERDYEKSDSGEENSS